MGFWRDCKKFLQAVDSNDHSTDDYEVLPKPDQRVLAPFFEVQTSNNGKRYVGLPVFDHHDARWETEYPSLYESARSKKYRYPFMCCKPLHELRIDDAEKRPCRPQRFALHLFDIHVLDSTPSVVPAQNSMLVFNQNGSLLTKKTLAGDFLTLCKLFVSTDAFSCGLRPVPLDHQCLIRFGVLVAVLSARNDTNLVCNLDRAHQDLYAVKVELPQFPYSNMQECEVVSTVLLRNKHREPPLYSMHVAETNHQPFLKNDVLKNLFCTYFRKTVYPDRVQSTQQLDHPGFTFATVVTKLEEQVARSELCTVPAPVQDLFENLEAGQVQSLDLKTVYSVLIWVVAPVSYLHEAGWEHNDISLENYLFHYRTDGSISVKLFDFGNATQTGSFLSMTLPYMGKHGYRPFEYESKGPKHQGLSRYDRRKADVFALGTLIHMLLLEYNMLSHSHTDDRGKNAYQVLKTEGWYAFVEFLIRQRLCCKNQLLKHYGILHAVSDALDPNVMTRITSEQLLGRLMKYYHRCFTSAGGHGYVSGSIIEPVTPFVKEAFGTPCLCRQCFSG